MAYATTRRQVMNKAKMHSCVRRPESRHTSSMGASADSWICDMVVDFNNEISLRSVGTPARRIFICCQKEESTLKLNRTA